MKILSFETSPVERQAYWDGLAKNYIPVKQAYSTKIYGDGEWRLFLKYFRDLKGKKALKLDLWNEANNTDILERAVRAGMEVTGIDISEVVVKRAIENFQQRGLKARFVQGDIRDLPFSDNEFDYLYTMGTIEHVPDPERAIKEIHRVLKPGGVAVIGVPYRYDIFGRAAVAYVVNKYNIGPYGEEMCFSWKEFRQLLSVVPFEWIDRSGVYFLPWPLRLIDVYLFQYARPLTYLFYPFLFTCTLLGNVDFLLTHNGLIAAVVRKK